MKHILTTLLLLFSLTLSAQTTVVTGPKKKPQTTAVDVNKRKAEADAAAKKRAAEEAAAAKRKAEQSAANKKAEQARQEKLRKEREEQARQEQLRREQAEQARQERLRQEQEAARQRAEAEAIQKAEAEAREKAMLLERSRPYLDELANNMVYVEGGIFTMGGTPEQGKDAYRAGTPHTVKLSSFYICKYEVTQDLWEVIMGNNPSKYKGAKRPVEQVSWYDCCTFINRLNWLTGKHYRLPTEAEWEFAARGGNKSKGYKYAGSNSLKKVAWYDEPYSKRSTHDVGLKNPNELGLYDMSGNVWEWCLDWSGDYTVSMQTNPTGPNSGSFRKRRGGGWFSHESYCRVSHSNGGAPDYRSNSLGLRLALVP